VRGGFRRRANAVEHRGEDALRFEAVGRDVGEVVGHHLLLALPVAEGAGGAVHSVEWRGGHVWWLREGRAAEGGAGNADGRREEGVRGAMGKATHMPVSPLGASAM